MANKMDDVEYTKADMKTWKQVISYLKGAERDVALLFVSVITLAGLDTLIPILNMMIIDNYVVPKNLEGLPMFGVLYVLVIMLFGFIVWAFILLADRIQLHISYKIRRDAFKKLQELSFSFYDTSSVGWLMSRLTSDTNRLGGILSWGLTDTIWGTMVMIFIMIVMFIINWKLALITVAILPILLLVSYFFQSKILKQYRRVRKMNSKITGAFNEGITGAVTTKTLVTEEDNLDEFKELTLDMRRGAVSAAIISAIYYPIIIALGSFGTALIIYKGGYDVFNQQISVGTLVLFITFSSQFFEPIRTIARLLTEFQDAQAAAERIMSLINTESDIVDRPDVIEKYGSTGALKKENWESLKGDIELVNVGFKYKNGEKVLEDMNLHIKPGESIAIVGPTGGGKSTIVNLICRFYEPTSGQILIDGIDYRERTQEWLHSNLGYVLQTPHLFSGSIKDNIKYGKLDATDEEIIKAAKLVNAHEFIMNFADGYDTVVGEGGAGLSTGQKQLVSFARALISNPAILVLDEATASIDIETEKLIQDAIQTMLKDRTSFIIAHRLSTIVNADKIIVLKAGDIAECGTHQELIALKGDYYQLYMGQFEKIN
ncbi:MAG TPA: ABC transporter ATP-binding protein [Firmicutes bacterium]|nr:ABC transporter ATP-binding protein [Bacillota bacterium]